jgi:hypothetical protein
MNNDRVGQIIVVLLAFLALDRLWADFKPTTAYAAGGVKSVKVEDYSGGPIHGFSCVYYTAVGIYCYILTDK